jgi:hypothetical protein
MAKSKQELRLERSEKLRRPMKWVYAFLMVMFFIGAFTGSSSLLWGSVALCLITACVTLGTRYIG